MPTPNAIVLTEGDEVTYTITVKRDGSAVNLSSPARTVELYATDEANAHTGTNQVDGLSCSFVTDGSDGQVTAVFTSTHTAIGGTSKDLKGKWALKLNTTAGDLDEWTDHEDFYIRRNWFIA